MIHAVKDPSPMRRGLDGFRVISRIASVGGCGDHVIWTACVIEEKALL
jgi:hypothetical protein